MKSAKQGFHHKHSLGQNFIEDEALLEELARLSLVTQEDCVLEIGPGFGALTKPLARRARQVLALEIDRALLPILQVTLESFGNVQVLQGDVMKTDLAALVKQAFGEDCPLRVAANLPYYITSPVIMRLLEERLPISAITVMVQKEAADRLCALPGTRACGAVSAAVQYYAEPEILFDVSRGSFMPAPNVDSAVIQLKIRKTPPVAVDDEKFFFRVVKAAFAQRRKTAVNSISNTMGLPKQTVTKAFEDAGIPANARAEALTLEALGSLSNRLFAAAGRKGEGHE